ncbi:MULTISPECIES: hypothetical protein [unclassified Deinococcus]|uniref:hypothetical protein n=1 Tax=unclassified Deinococcus TaxID=2623546 RepID=UPI001C303396|nr:MULTISPECIES: hypothetical protein [unclassified Deinococcus]MDK2014702.1 hypothetical protein [Deinococcus sp. 43]
MPLGPKRKLVPHNLFHYNDPRAGSVPIANMVLDLQGNHPEHLWVEKVTGDIGNWRSKFREAYIRWSLSINGLLKSSEFYRTDEWKDPRRIFIVQSIRGAGTTEVITQWSGAEAANAHEDTVHMISAYGVMNLYGLLEEWVFETYRVYLSQHPDNLLRGDEYKDLRRLRAQYAADPASNQAEWQLKLEKRLDSWQRKRLYDGLGRVFKSLCADAKLKTPSRYRLSTVDTWAESITGLGLLRNALTHNVTVVSKELGDFCKMPYGLGLDFKEGEPLIVELRHLMLVDNFLDSLLTGFNLSIVELVYGPLGKRLAKD